MSNKAREPPAFISETKSFATYKRDLQRWCNLTTLTQEQQADMVVHCLDGHPSGIKEKIDTQLSATTLSSKDGIKSLLDFLESVYAVDEMGDSFEKYLAFERCRRKKGQRVQEFLADWENTYAKVKVAGCEMSDQVLAYKLLHAMDLTDMDKKLVLTGVDYAVGKEKKNMLSQMAASLKKFVGRGMVGADDQVIKAEEEMEKVFIAKGWKKPGGGAGGGRTRTRSNSLPGNTGAGGSYKGRKNALGSDFKPLKCFKCKCEHTDKCTCPCVYHLANNCTTSKAASTKNNSAKAELGLFMRMNTPGLQVQEALYMMDDKKDKLNEEEIVLLTNSLKTLCLVEGQEHCCALIDCACPNTVAGIMWMKKFIAELSTDQKQRVEVESSNRVYKFGGGETRPSKCLVKLPCHLAGRNVSMKIEVVDADIPLLVGNSTLKKAKAVLHIAERKVEVMGTKIDMTETSSGHFRIPIGLPSEVSNQEEDMCLVIQQEELTKKRLEKLHHYFGHTRVDKLMKLIKGAGRETSETEKWLEEIKKDCESCRVNNNRLPRPAVAIPRATRCNEFVTLDLKEWGEGRHRYILYIVDMFSRFTAAAFLTNKQAATVGEAVLAKWVNVFGSMAGLHSDRGSEFLNEEMTRLCEYLGVKQTATAAYSPNQNGTNERNHAVVDRMLEKMLMADPSLKPEVALCWAVNAKNSLETYQGFSPSQIVFGENPRLPAIYAAGPPGLEETTMSKAMADHINALHSAREAFIQCESDRVLKTALRKRVYSRPNQISPGDWIYFRNKSKRWEGPVKVTTLSGKLLYAIRAGSLLTINSDHAVLVKAGDEVVAKDAVVPQSTEAPVPESDDDEDDEQETVVAEQETVAVEQEIVAVELETVAAGEQSRPGEGEATSDADTDEAPSAVHPVIEGDDEALATPGRLADQDRMELEEGAEELPESSNQVSAEVQVASNKISFKNIKRNTTIRFKLNDGDEWRVGKVLFRAGKAKDKSRGKTTFQHYWNITDLGTNHTEPMNTETFKEIELVPDGAETEVLVEEAFAVNLPRFRHGERRCIEAKEAELEKFDEFAVYDEVRDEGQQKLGTHWVLTEKIDNAGGSQVKARLTIRGDQEEGADDIRSDSPTVNKGNIKICLAIAAKQKWVIKTSDVTSAFLQSVPIDRDVFVQPPRERRVPGVIWKLTKTVYGLSDASRGFYLSFSRRILELGCVKCVMDPAMYLYYDQKDTVEMVKKEPLGIAVSHVDDMLHAGTQQFQDKVMKPLQQSFKFGTHESSQFRYVGMNIS